MSMEGCKYYCFGCSTGECPKIIGDILWVSGRLVDVADTGEWVFCGLYRTKEEAIRKAVDEKWFVAPIDIGKAAKLPVLASDAYFPVIEHVLGDYFNSEDQA